MSFFVKVVVLALKPTHTTQSLVEEEMLSIRDKIDIAVRARAGVVEGTIEWIQLDELICSLLEKQHKEVQALNRAALDAAQRRSGEYWAPLQ